MTTHSKGMLIWEAQVRTKKTITIIQWNHYFPRCFECTNVKHFGDYLGDKLFLADVPYVPYMCLHIQCSGAKFCSTAVDIPPQPWEINSSKKIEASTKKNSITPLPFLFIKVSLFTGSTEEIETCPFYLAIYFLIFIVRPR
jgi:hypothetical protein